GRADRGGGGPAGAPPPGAGGLRGAPGARAGVPPPPLRPSFLRRLHRAVDVLGRRGRHLGDLLACRGVDDVHGLAAGGLDPLAPDQVLVLLHRDAHPQPPIRLLRAYTAVSSTLSAAAVSATAPLRRTPVSRVSRCATVTGITVKTMTTKATTLTTGNCWPWRRLSRMKIGNVV